MQPVYLEMNGQTFLLVFMVVCGAIGGVSWFLQRDANWGWSEHLVLWIAGVGAAGFFFCGGLHTNLSPPNRPVLPEPALGYTHLFTTRHGNVYGTLFEYLAVTWGIWAMWGLAAVVTLIFFKLKNSGSPRNPWQVWAAAAISMPLYCASGGYLSTLRDREYNRVICPTGKSVRLSISVCPAPFAKIF